jgi:hypothetical protein
VISQAISLTRKGRPILDVTRATQLWARFRFAPGALPRKPIRAHWLHKGKPKLSFRVRAPRPYSFYRRPGGLQRGRWTCELRMGKKLIARQAVHVG